MVSEAEAEDRPPSGGLLALGRSATEAARPPRRRLFIKYALSVIALVGAALLINSGLDFWFSYQENKAALVSVQREKAEAAAQRIVEFVEEIKNQIGWTTHAQWAAGPLDQRRQDYVRLLRQVPAITELSQLDGQGHEQLKVSRLAMDVVGSDADFSQSPAFTEAKAHRIWFSPVYFRKESEPYMTLAMARDGKNAGVTVAEINLKLIWDVITGLRIGKGGYAYVVDDRGRLIAHPDISLVLRDTNLAELPQVAAALGATPGKPIVAVAKGLDDRSVLTAQAAIAPLGWHVFVEVPLREAFAPLYLAALRMGLLLGFGLIAATLVALLLARRMTGPIRAIADGAAQIGAGDLSRRIDIHTGDELEGLAQQFNDMAADLQKSYAELEQRVADRTAELSEALDQQTATAEVLGVINSSPGDLAPVFDAMLDKAMRLCDADFGIMFTIDGASARMVAARDVPAALLDFVTSHPPGIGPDTFFGRAVLGRPLLHTADVREEVGYRSGEAIALTAADHAGVRALLMAPLLKDDGVLGVFGIFRREVRPFTDKQIALLQNFAAQAVIAMENARLITETREALDQQTATAEVLGVINSSPGDLAPVFDAMLEKAMRLCDASFGCFFTCDGERFPFVAHRGLSAEFAEAMREPVLPPPGSALARIGQGEAIVQVADVSKGEAYRSGSRGSVTLVDIGGARTAIWVALRKEEALLGVFSMFRQEVRPFSDKQIALLQNFAAQAVIAMENARLITETREALEQQTATAEVLGVINSSPGDLAPVFDAILEKAHSLCGIAQGSLELYDGERFRAVAVRGLSDAFADMLRQGYPASDNPATRPLIEGERFTYIPDLADTEYSITRTSAELEAVRTLLCVPLRRDDVLLGMIASARKEARPFSEKEIALLENFAAQAVIAMENARLITETREALEQQTATAEVLGVINSSPGDLAPVFDAMLGKALHLCDAALGTLYTYDGEAMRAAVTRGVSEELSEFLTGRAHRPGAGALGRLVRGEPFVQILDISIEEPYQSNSPLARALVDVGKVRTNIAVPLRKDDVLLGAIAIYRQEVRPFSDKQIALLQNFAAQAVIAMENARLITETREALEQQTATAEVLGVINSSPGDLAPVFDAMLAKAVALCDAAHGVLRTFDGEFFHIAAMHGEADAVERLKQLGAIDLDSVRADDMLGPIVRGESVVHIADVRETDTHRNNPLARERAEAANQRTWLAVALRNDRALLGVIMTYRTEVRPFTDKHIALLQNFAAQAVIAMESARLVTETREALEQQTATAEVLGVINSSPGNLAPVFDAMLEKALHLCEAAFGALRGFDGETFPVLAVHGFATHGAIKPEPDSALGRLSRGDNVVHIPDVIDTDGYRSGLPSRVALVHNTGARTALWVALRKEQELLGAFVIYRREVRPFSDKQIALLQNFAAQAVIAMENARLLTETRERTHDLQESLEYQTATSDVLQVISRSTFDLEPVLQTVAETAARLCGADLAFIVSRQGEVYRTAASYALLPEWDAFVRKGTFTPGRGTLIGRAMLEARVVHVADITADPEHAVPEAITIGKSRTGLAVPLMREDELIGVITLGRQRVEPFTDRQIELVRTFADQAVIAIENARLLNELRERTRELASSVEELKMLGEVGQAVSSTLDVKAVLSKILNASLGVTWANAGAIFRYSRAQRAFRLVEAVGWDEALARSVRELRVAETESAMGEAAARRMPIQLADLAQRPSNPLRDVTLAAGFHSALIVPLVGAERILGAIILMRQEAGEFPAETVRLMQTLASQSVLAIQNARLFREIADKSEELRLASQHKSRFLANMSHELRTPLNAILGYTELLVDGIYGGLPQRAAGVLERVQNNGRHLLALINDVLDLSKIEAGQLVLTLEDYSLPDVVQSVVTATEPLASTKGIKMTAIVASGLPTGHGDARRLSQVLLNLVGNAVKFTDQGEVAIGAKAENGNFVLSVRDTGPGIAPEDHDKIFGEFQQVDNSNTRKKGGTGLGLAISKRMVEMQGGSITVESELGHGATFRVMLPIRVEEMPDELTGEFRGAA